MELVWCLQRLNIAYRGITNATLKNQKHPLRQWPMHFQQSASRCCPEATALRPQFAAGIRKTLKLRSCREKASHFDANHQGLKLVLTGGILRRTGMDQACSLTMAHSTGLPKFFCSRMRWLFS